MQGCFGSGYWFKGLGFRAYVGFDPVIKGEQQYVVGFGVSVTFVAPCWGEVYRPYQER